MAQRRVPPSLAPTQALVDPKTIVGYVKCKDASEDLLGKHRGEVVSVRSEPLPGFGVVRWRIQLRGTRGVEGGIGILTPPALPPPLIAGDPVSFAILGGGGGPNRSHSVVIEAHDGSLLLAIDRAPQGWQVTEGKSTGTTQQGSYTTREFGVLFERGSLRIESNAKWVRAEVDGVPYYFWGGGAERKTPKGARHPPDYVGGWMDFAIVRAR